MINKITSFIVDAVNKLMTIKGDSDAPNSLKLARTGNFVVIFGFMSFFLWAMFVPLSEGVIAFGSLVVDGNKKAVQHLEGGIVKALYMKEGDLVEAGQVLIELDDTQSRAQFEMLSTRYYTSLAMYGRLMAERLNADMITFSSELLAKMSEPNIELTTSIQVNLFNARRAQLLGQIDILNQKIDQLKKQHNGMKSQSKAINETITYTKDELNRLVRLEKKNLVDLPRVLAQRIALSQAEGQQGQVTAEMAGLQVAISEARLQILQIENTNQQEIETSVVETQERLLETREQLAAVKDIMVRTKILAPQSGKVIGLNVFTVGGVVPAGNPLMEIVPSNTEMVIEARLKPIDVDNVIAGMPARIRLSALKQRTTPELAGVVLDVSGDIVKDPATEETYYSARISIPVSEIERVGNQIVVPGMPVEILIKAGERTAMEYLTDPIFDILRRAMKEG